MNLKYHPHISNRDIHLVCGVHIKEVENFLLRFFEKKKVLDNQSDQITFVTPDKYFQIILSKGPGLSITQGVILEILSESMNQLSKFSKDNKTSIKKFIVQEINGSYFCYFAEIFGPKDICRIRMNYSERLRE